MGTPAPGKPYIFFGPRSEFSRFTGYKANVPVESYLCMLKMSMGVVHVSQ